MQNAHDHRELIAVAKMRAPAKSNIAGTTEQAHRTEEDLEGYSWGDSFADGTRISGNWAFFS